MIIRISSTRSPATSTASAPWPSTPPVPLITPSLTPRPLRRHGFSRLLLPPLGRGNGEPAPPPGRPRARRHGPVLPARREPRGDLRPVGRLPAVGPAIGAQRAGSAGRKREKRALDDAQGHAKGMLCCRFAPNGFQVGQRTAVKGSWRRGATTTRSRCGICGGRRRFTRCRRTET